MLYNARRFSLQFTYVRAVFNCESKEISRLLWFCITALCDRLTKLAPLSQPMGIPWNSDWLVVLFTSVAIGQSNYFGFGFTTLNWKPL